MEFKTDEYGGARFVVPDNPTVLQILLHDSVRYDAMDKGAILNLWDMAKTLIVEWECESLPDINADLNEITDARAARVIEWAGITVSMYRRGLDAIEKNS